MSGAGIDALLFDVFVPSGRLADDIGRSTLEQRSRPKLIEAEVVWSGGFRFENHDVA